MSKILVQLTHPPYSGSHAEDGLDFVLAASNYGHEVAVLFVGDGVFQLQHNQAPTQGPNHSKRLKMMPLYDIDDVYVSEHCMAQRGLSEDGLIPLDKHITAMTSIKTLIQQYQHVVTF